MTRAWNAAAVALMVVMGVVLARTAWVCDDAFITFRTVDNLLAGNGAVWNAGERVQTYTHPLWMLLLAGARALTGECVVTSMVLGAVATAVAAGLLAWVVAPDRRAGALGLLAMLCSRAVIDFGTSGLENGLLYLLLVAAAAAWLRAGPGRARLAGAVAVLAALAMTTRLDALWLVAPLVVAAALAARRRPAWAWVALGLTPLLLWEAWALLYYGSPVPNTAYAKLPLWFPAGTLARQGAWYLLDAVRHDPVTAAVIGAALVLPLATRRWRLLPVSAGLLLHLAYVVRVGGDFMAGRFLAAAAVLGLVVVVRSAPARSTVGWAACLATLVVLATITGSSLPWATGPRFGAAGASGDAHGIVDERSWYYPHTGLLRAGAAPGGAPEHEMVDLGLRFRDTADQQNVRWVGSVGMVGYYAGSGVDIIDTHGIADPLLGRLPTCATPEGGWRIGHFPRTVPEGYLDSRVQGANLLWDRRLGELYDLLERVSTGPLLDRGRLAAIVEINTVSRARWIDRDTYTAPCSSRPADTGSRPGGRRGPALGRHGTRPSRGAVVQDVPELPASELVDTNRFNPVRRAGGAELTPEQRRLLEQLEAIGYAEGTRVAGGSTGVLRHDPDAAWTGWNLYNAGDSPSATLMDMDGRVIHRWSCPFRKAFPRTRVSQAQTGTRYWRRVRLLEGGSLLAIYEGLGIVELDRDSNVVWAVENGAHHDMDVLEDGRIVTLVRVARMIPSVNPLQPVAEDLIAVLDPAGKELRRVSLLDAFEASDEYRHIWRARSDLQGDLFHTNTVHVLDGSLAGVLPPFRAGRVLTSMRYLHTIAVVDLDRAEVVWAAQGTFRDQHDPQVLPGGTLLLFDNRGPAGLRSAVLELDPVTMRPVWTFVGTEDEPLYSRNCGAAQRLPNGNTLITETDGGRALEVTRGGRVVWEFVNPHTAGEDDELRANLFEVQRLPPDLPLDWLPGDATAPVEGSD